MSRCKFSFAMIALISVFLLFACEDCGRGEDGDSCRSTADCKCGLNCIEFVCVDKELREEEENSMLAKCKLYCEKIQECDASGTVTDEVVETCKTACDSAIDENSGYSVDEDLINCASENSCEDFQACIYS